MAKRKKANKRKKQKKIGINDTVNENIIALVMILSGIIILLTVSVKSIGIVGVFLRTIILSLFSGFSYIIAVVLIAFGAYKIIGTRNFKFKNINKGDLAIFILLLNFLYVIVNISYMKKHTDFSFSTISEIATASGEFSDIGLIPYAISFFFYKLIGKAGIMVFETAGALYLLIKYEKDEVIEFYKGIKDRYEKIKNGKDKIKEEKKQEEKLSITMDIFSDRPMIEDTKKEKKPNLLKFDTPVDISEEENPINNRGEISENPEEITINFAQNPQDFEKETDKEEIFSAEEEYENDEIIQKEDIQDCKENNQDIENIKDESENRPYTAPTFDLLNDYEVVKISDRQEKIEKAKILQKTLQSFSVEAVVENISVGPTITRYELKPKIGTKVSKITNLTEDLALALAAKSIRIEAPIPGKPYIGVEVPNEVMQTVSFKEIIKTCMEKKDKYKIVFAMGKDISGDVILSDITKMPHALIAGSTGSGKSVCINTMICSIIYNYSPQEVKLILVDPKVVELSVYNKLPHLVIPVVTDMKKAPHALNWAVNEMEKRYKAFADSKAKDITSYNQKAEEKMPRIVIIIDELADLMMVAAKEIEEAICRLAQKARACGIHLIVATQRPSVDVITGLIKANIPSRIAFAVSSQTDSRTILDTSGAEKLLGKGDMLYCPIGMNKPVRIQGAFLSEEEVERITGFIEKNNKVENLQDIQREVTNQIEQISNASSEKENMVDELYSDVVEFACKNQEISVSLVQRQFRVGYNRASRIVDEMEKNGIVGKSDGSKPRKVIKNNLN